MWEREWWVMFFAYEMAQVDILEIDDFDLVGYILELIFVFCGVFWFVHFLYELIGEKASCSVEVFEFCEIVAEGDCVYDRYFFEGLWLFFVDDLLVEMILQVG